MAEARFARGGWRASDSNSGITIRTLNPQRGSSWSVAERIALFRRALETLPPEGGVSLYLTAAGFFGKHAKPGKTSEDAGPWDPLSARDLATISRSLGGVAANLSPATYLAVGVDRDKGKTQELWCYRGGARAPFRVLSRGEQPEPIDFGGFKAIAFICGAIYDPKDGAPLDVKRHLRGIDVVLDAAHVSLNRIGKPLVPLSRRRWAFQRKIREIGARCGAIFAHAHGPLYGKRVRDCDNWIVYRDGDPFPGEPRGTEIKD